MNFTIGEISNGKILVSGQPVVYERICPVASVYSELLLRHRDAGRDQDEPKRQRLFVALDVIRELWPVEIKAWEKTMWATE
jgi:hypothetical protein